MEDRRYRRVKLQDKKGNYVTRWTRRKGFKSRYRVVSTGVYAASNVSYGVKIGQGKTELRAPQEKQTFYITATPASGSDTGRVVGMFIDARNRTIARMLAKAEFDQIGSGFVIREVSTQRFSETPQDVYDQTFSKTGNVKAVAKRIGGVRRR